MPKPITNIYQAWNYDIGEFLEELKVNPESYKNQGLCHISTGYNELFYHYKDSTILVRTEKREWHAIDITATTEGKIESARKGLSKLMDYELTRDLPFRRKENE